MPPGPHVLYVLGRVRVPASLGTYWTHRAACPQGPTYCTYGVRVPASGVGYVPRTVATQVVPTTVLRLERLAFERILGPLVMSKVRVRVRVRVRVS